jgi:hypothetical protein
MEPSPPPGPYVAPNHRIPRVLGILNIVFAANIMVCGLCSGLTFVFGPSLARSTQDMQKKLTEGLKARRLAEIEELKDKEKAAKTEAEIQELRERRAVLQAQANQVVVMPPDMSTMGLTDPNVVAFAWVDLLTNLLLNVLMLVAGIGLVARRRWSPRLGVATASAKVVRLVLLYGFFALAIVPGLSRRMGQATAAMYAQQGGGGMPSFATSIEFLTKTIMIEYSAFAAAMIVFGVIYPAASIWLLTRPGVREACAGGKPEMEPSEPW